MTTRNFAIRLSLEESETVKRGLVSLGKEGQTALASIERGGKPASAGLLAINNASLQVQGGMQALAGRTGVLGGVLTALGPAGLAAAAGLGGLVVATRAALQRSEEALDSATQLADTADKLGIGIEALQEYRTAAEQAGVAQDTFDLALQRFTRRAAEAAKGQGEAKDALKQLGIQLTDTSGRLRPTEDLLGDVADAMAKTDGQAERLRLGFKLFDSEGVALVNMLQNGSAALEQMRQRARDTGVVLDEKMVLSARETKNELDLMRKVIQTQLDGAFLSLAPTLVSSAALFADIATAVADVVDGMRALEERSTRGLKSRLMEIDAALPELRRQSTTAPDELLVGDIGVGIGSRQSVEGKIAQLERERDLVRQQLDLRAQEAAARQQGAPGGIGGDAKAEADAIDALIGKMREEIDILGIAKERREEETAVRKARALAIEKEIKFTEKDEALVRGLVRQKQQLAAADTAGTEAQRAANQVRDEARRLMEGVRTEEEKLVELQTRLNELVAAGAITQANANTVLERTQARLAGMNDVAGQLGRGLSSAFADAIVGGEGFRQVLGGIEQDILRILTQNVITEPAGNAFSDLFSQGLSAVVGTLFGGGSAGGLGSLSFGGPRAGGGPVEPGRWYMVGERGPERFAPAVPGRIVSSDQVRGSGASVSSPQARAVAPVYVTINNHSAAQVTTREAEAPGGGRSLEIVMDDAMARQVRRAGSNTSRALSETFGAQRALASR